MAEPIRDLARARIMIANDDGVGAPGIKLLEKVARTLSKDVWVVAPEGEQSAVAHSLTLRRPLRIRKLSKQKYCVDGTPTDSVLLGIQEVLKDKKPDLLLSGINFGGNLADDVTYSGTVAAAMEGTMLGIPSIALSQLIIGDHKIHWATAEAWAAKVIRKVTAIGWPKDALINVNFPDVPAAKVKGIAVVEQGRHKLGDEITERVDPRGRAYYWIGGLRIEDRGTPDTDLDAVSRGLVSVTPLSLDLTHRAGLREMQKRFR
jgi:5'-nucleotidase